LGQLVRNSAVTIVVVCGGGIVVVGGVVGVVAFGGSPWVVEEASGTAVEVVTEVTIGVVDGVDPRLLELVSAVCASSRSMVTPPATSTTTHASASSHRKGRREWPFGA
jgi:hypothetical protein